jgi:hypothetical protein
LSTRPGCAHPSYEQRRKIMRMKSIPRLKTSAIESDIVNLPSPQMRVNPKGENSLGCRAELSSAG